MAVGYRPSQVAFAGEDYAYVVTEDGISQIDLSSQPPVTSSLFPLTASTTLTQSEGTDAEIIDATSPGPADGSTDAGGALQGDGAPSDAAHPAMGGDAESVLVLPPEDEDGGSATTPDVSFTPDGNYALIRQDGLAFITVVSFATGALTAVPLPSAPTDLDLSPTGDFAVAVLRDTSTVAVLPIPGVVTNPSSVTMISIGNEVVGRGIVTPDGKSVLLFTTVTTVPDSQDLTVLTLSPPSIRTIALHESVLAVFPTPDSKNAVVLHDVTPTAGVLGAYSLVPIASNLPVQLVSTPAEPTAVAISPESDRVVIALRDDPTQTYALDLGLFPSLQYIRQALASPPTAAGIVAGAGQGYAAQSYDEGRITFVELYPPDGGTPGQALTITGFDLGARIVDGRDE